MAELTAEQLSKAEGMTLEELKQMALRADLPAPVPVEKPRDASGQFVKHAVQDELDNSGDTDGAAVVVDPPEKKVYRQEILNDDGHLEVYEGESLGEVANKLSEGKRHANNKIRELITELRAAEAKVAQSNDDDEYVTKKNLESNPKQTIEQILDKRLDAKLEVVAAKQREQEAGNKRSLDVAQRFVDTHPQYVADPKNGNPERMLAEFARLNPTATELTSEGLEKAYSSLAKSGLLVLKTEGADDATAGKVEVTQRTVEPTTEPTQQRSSRSSGISTRNRPAAPVTNQQPSLDEAYSLPMDKLRELANKQLAQNNS